MRTVFMFRLSAILSRDALRPLALKLFLVLHTFVETESSFETFFVKSAHELR